MRARLLVAAIDSIARAVVAAAVVGSRDLAFLALRTAAATTEDGRSYSVTFLSPNKFAPSLDLIAGRFFLPAFVLNTSDLQFFAQKRLRNA
jgi:hypothetical protein